jgi:hypothetical protein
MNLKFNKNFIYIILLCAFAIILIILVNNDDKSSIEKLNDKYKVVNNASNFFTIENCINKYINVVKNKDTDSIMLLLNNDYKIEKNVTIENVYNFTPDITKRTTYQAQKMYNKSNSYQYYVSGYFMEETIDSLKIKDNYYFIVSINKNDGTFNITPYEGDIFIKGGIDNG